MKLYNYQPHKSSIIEGFPARWMAVIAFLGGIVLELIPDVGNFLGWILPLIILLLETNSHLVRISAAQSFTINLGQLIINIVLAVINVATFQLVSPVVSAIGWLVKLVVWAIELVAAYKCISWQSWQIPFIYPAADLLEHKVGGIRKVR
ncbi:DUF4870 domain-containing protein [Oscillospiraceae bacterium HV4-5-C5C]|nr:DUF4870 domain-containing protein [Oscillospiraceae bacterium HV4-5-C5C]